MKQFKYHNKIIRVKIGKANKDINGNIWMKTNKGWVRMLDNSFSLKQPECCSV